MRSEMQEGFAQLHAETAARRQLQAEIRTCREEAAQWKKEYAELVMGSEDATETVALYDAPWTDPSAAASRAAEPQGAPWSFWAGVVTRRGVLGGTGNSAVFSGSHIFDVLWR